MILVDTSIWVDHLRDGDPLLRKFLRDEEVLMHPFILGEIALGYLRRRERILSDLNDLPQSSIAEDEEVVQFIAAKKIIGKGVGYIDVHLVVSAILTPDTQLWTRDKRLAEIAESLHIAFQSKVN